MLVDGGFVDASFRTKQIDRVVADCKGPTHCMLSALFLNTLVIQ